MRRGSFGCTSTDQMSASASGSASRSNLPPRLALRKRPLVLPTSTVSLSLGCTVIACTSAPSGRPLFSCSHRLPPTSWRKMPPKVPLCVIPTVAATPAYTCVVPAIVPSSAKSAWADHSAPGALVTKFAAWLWCAGHDGGNGDERQRDRQAADRPRRAGGVGDRARLHVAVRHLRAERR